MWIELYQRYNRFICWLPGLYRRYKRHSLPWRARGPRPGAPGAHPIPETRRSVNSVFCFVACLLFPRQQGRGEGGWGSGGRELGVLMVPSPGSSTAGLIFCCERSVHAATMNGVATKYPLRARAPGARCQAGAWPQHGCAANRRD